MFASEPKTGIRLAGWVTITSSQPLSWWNTGGRALLGRKAVGILVS